LNVPDIIDSDNVVNETLKDLQAKHIACFEEFHEREQPFDLVEALLLTGTLNTTDPRDRIYGVLGATDFPAKAVSIESWLTERQNSLFIPIDYAVDLTSINIAITWNFLMKLGLRIIAKFKIFSHETNHLVDESLPSWAIDWQLVSRLYKKLSGKASHKASLTHPWPIKWSSEAQPKLHPRVLAVQDQLCHDNTSAIQSLNRIILRGSQVQGLVLKNGGVYQKKWTARKKMPLDEKPVWELHFNSRITDIVVQLDSFIENADINKLEMHWANPQTGIPMNSTLPCGLWVLRPTEDNEFKLLACLACDHPGTDLYTDWDDPNEFFVQTRRDGYRLLVTPEKRLLPDSLTCLKPQTFIII
jgi:hypothetical protein